MKYLIKLVLFITVISFGGCYTILWSPKDQLPSENNNQVFYTEPYYGEYNYYYDNPWWITGGRSGRQIYIAPTPTPSQSTGRSGSATSIRDNNGSRNNPDNNGSVLRTDTPSRNGNTNNSAASKTETNNNTNNSGEQTRSSKDSRSNEGSNSVRNNNGSRNSGNERR